MSHYLRNWRKQHREEGLCIDCNAFAYQGNVRCLKHALAANATRKVIRDRNKIPRAVISR